MFDSQAPHPCEQLLGQVLPNGWEVIEWRPSPHTRGGTGGHFSTGYIVRSPNGKLAFLKALDMWDALSLPDAAAEMQARTQAYLYERNLLGRCRERHLDRVVTAIDSGQAMVSGFPVPYLIFECADGDVRAHVVTLSDQVEVAWKLRSLHHVATALQQLHGMDVAHQDLKPSNVLVFARAGCKVGDVGRASTKGNRQPHDNLPFAGDRTYAPPELLYGVGSQEWVVRCLGCDVYHLGSMLAYYFLQFGTTALVLSRLHPSLHFQVWDGPYADVLPHLREAFNAVVLDFEQAVPPDLRPEISVVLRQLCDPDPSLRGHPAQRVSMGNPYRLDRYVSLFNKWAARAEYGMLKLASAKP